MARAGLGSCFWGNAASSPTGSLAGSRCHRPERRGLGPAGQMDQDFCHRACGPEEAALAPIPLAIKSLHQR